MAQPKVSIEDARKAISLSLADRPDYFTCRTPEQQEKMLADLRATFDVSPEAIAEVEKQFNTEEN